MKSKLFLSLSLLTAIGSLNASAQRGASHTEERAVNEAFRRAPCIRSCNDRLASRSYAVAGAFTIGAVTFVGCAVYGARAIYSHYINRPESKNSLIKKSGAEYSVYEKDIVTALREIKLILQNLRAASSKCKPI